MFFLFSFFAMITFSSRKSALILTYYDASKESTFDDTLFETFFRNFYFFFFSYGHHTLLKRIYNAFTTEISIDPEHFCVSYKTLKFLNLPNFAVIVS